MTETVAPQTRSQIMSRVCSKGTSPELSVRRAIQAAGFRFRVRERFAHNPPPVLRSKDRQMKPSLRRFILDLTGLEPTDNCAWLSSGTLSTYPHHVPALLR